MTERTTTRRRASRQARRGAAAVLALGTVTTLAACGDDPVPAGPPPAPAEVAAYEQTRQDLVVTLEEVFGADGWVEDRATSATAQDDGRCVVRLPDARTTRADGTGYDLLEDVPAAIAPVLDEHGFGEPSDLVHPEHGGSAHVEAEDAAGWSVTVRADGDLVRLDVTGPVDLDPCDASGLPGLG